ncbi:uncharacterized protein FIBRA_01584 [Fibroporia radiculosa]|uniref:SPX domain-containing protein n=1 Tax=Fibroporia radiculosa TaxID=599839 RepID=J4I8K4_9APHY|nr:uncharacterized protein FIBRA_01584 [Fibroporia radiculosa]CCL99566.1 predicted protein [Fibroporia radiculosa]
MKFARYLEETQTPEWKKAYIDYRGLKKKITAIRRAQDELKAETGSVRPNVNADTCARPSSNSADVAGKMPDLHTFADANTSEDEEGPMSSVAHSNSGASIDKSLLPRLRRRSTALSVFVRSQLPSPSHELPQHPPPSAPPATGLSSQHTQASPSEQRRANIRALWSLGENPPLRELLPLLTPVQRAFFEMLDGQLDMVESFFCARELEVRQKYDALKAQLHALKDHRQAFHEAHPHVSATPSWLPFTLPPIPFVLRRLHRQMVNIRLKPGSSAGRHGKLRKPSSDKQTDQDEDGGTEERAIGESDSIPSHENGLGEIHSVATVEDDNPVGHSNEVALGTDPGSPADTIVDVHELQRAHIGSKDRAPRRSLLESRTSTLNEASSPRPRARLPQIAEVARDPDEYIHAKKKLRKAIQEFYRGVEVLNNYRTGYQTLNLIGFRKALKKLEKVTHIPAQQAYTIEKIEPSAFASGASLNSMLRETEDLFAARFARGDKKKAQARLRGGTQQKTHHFSTFRTGMLLGLAVPALVDGVYRSFQPETRTAIPSWDGLLFVYGIFSVPALFLLLVGINLLVWHKARINYVFIFEFDLRTRLDHRAYFELPSLMISTLCYAFWLSFARVGASSVDPSNWALIWLAWAMAVWLNPLPILWRSSRYWLIRNIARQLTSGVRRVEFQDFFMGDQFCSVVFTLGDLFFVGCAYDRHLGNWRICTTGQYWAPAFAFAAIPLFARFVQSIRRWVDSRLNTHLINAGKYGTGVIYYFSYYLWRATGGQHGPRFVAWLVLGVIYASYAAAWDITMDWSLMRPHAKHRFLRSDLMYPSYIWLYYFAIISDIIIRFEFLMYVPQQGINYEIRTWIAGMLEMLRRWQWNFFRMENEHIGNMDQYRVTREVPLPYSFDHSPHESDGDEDDDPVERASTSSKSWRASGVLGSAIYDAYKSSGHDVLGLAHSRPTDELKKVDLLDLPKVEQTFTRFKPDWVIHCAAERRPDVAERDPEATHYVFDGTSPPYTPSAVTNPVNLYGTTKRDGELAVLGVVGSKSIVLRVPVLYGPAPHNTDSAVNVLLDVVTDQSGKQYKMDHYATRYPTNVVDIADFLARLISLPSSREVPPILHYSAGEPFTKYEMCLVFSRILNLPHAHIIPDAEPPKGDAATTRPRDCQLYTRETEDLIEGYGGLGWTPFEEWWEGHLKTQQ